MMRAAWYEQCGAAAEVLRVGEMAVPEPGAGEVLVRLRASGINPVDVKRRLGARGGPAAGRVVPHFDGGGEVVAVGAGVPESRIGERVWIFGGQWQRDLGTAAEYIALPSRQAVVLPGEVGFAEASCLGIPALTAHRAVHVGGSVEGETVLVTGAAGAVGRYAVQFAKMGGARVIATVSSEEKAASARAAGADVVINYRTEDVVARVQEVAGSVDKIVEVEFGGNLPVSMAVLKPGGTIHAYASETDREPALPFYEMMYRGIRLLPVLTFLTPRDDEDRALAEIARGMAEGTLTHHVGPRFPLDAIVAAHEAVESGVWGKVVLEIA